MYGIYRKGISLKIETIILNIHTVFRPKRNDIVLRFIILKQTVEYYLTQQ